MKSSDSKAGTGIKGCFVTLNIVVNREWMFYPLPLFKIGLSIPEPEHKPTDKLEDRPMGI